MLIIICIVLFIIFGFFFFEDYYYNIKSNKENENLANKVNNARNEATLFRNSLRDTLKELHEKKADMVAWILIEGTDLDYPVMYTPDDLEYYIRKNFDNEYSSNGSLFIGDGCTPDSDHIIIYGHNVKADGTMFGYLMNYDSKEYLKNHPIITYDTLNETHKYQIMTMFYSELYNSNDVNEFRYYNYADLSNEDTFNYYVGVSISSSIHDIGLVAEYGDRILTLSTCSYHKKNGRFVVVAVEKQIDKAY